MEQDEDNVDDVIIQTVGKILKEGFRQGQLAPSSTANQALHAIDGGTKERLLAPLATALARSISTEKEAQQQCEHVRRITEAVLTKGLKGLIVVKTEEEEAEGEEEDKVGNEDEDDPWSSGGGGGGGDATSLSSYSIFGPGYNKDKGGSFSLFSMLEIPDVVMVDLGMVARQLQETMKREQKEGLRALENSLLGDLTYSEHWPDICEGLARLLTVPGGKEKGMEEGEEEGEEYAVPMRTVKLYRKLFDCLTSRQRADIYLAVTIDIIQTFRTQIWVLPPPSFPSSSSSTSPPSLASLLEATPAGCLLWAKILLFHKMQKEMPAMFPHLLDRSLHSILIWTCLLLRTLTLSPFLPPSLLLSPAHFLAVVDGKAEWFRQWCLRLPPTLMSYMVARTGLLEDLLQQQQPQEQQQQQQQQQGQASLNIQNFSNSNCGSKDTSSSNSTSSSTTSNPSDVHVMPLPPPPMQVVYLDRTEKQPSISSHSLPSTFSASLVAKQWQTAGMCMLSHLCTTSSLLFDERQQHRQQQHQQQDNEKAQATDGCVESILPLWRGTPVLFPEQLPTGPCDVNLTLPDPATGMRLHLHIKTFPLPSSSHSFPSDVEVAACPFSPPLPLSSSRFSYLARLAKLFLTTMLALDKEQAAATSPAVAEERRKATATATAAAAAAATAATAAAARQLHQVHNGDSAISLLAARAATFALLTLPLHRTPLLLEDTFKRLVRGINALVFDQCFQSSPHLHLILRAALHISNQLFDKPRKEDEEEREEDEETRDLRADLFLLHRNVSIASSFYRTRFSTLLPLYLKRPFASSRELQTLFCRSILYLYRARPTVMGDLRYWPAPNTLPLDFTMVKILENEEGVEEEDRSGKREVGEEYGRKVRERACAILVPFLWDFQGVLSLLEMKEGSPLAHVLRFLNQHVLRRLSFAEKEEEGGREEEKNENKNEDDQGGSLLPLSLPLLGIFLQNIACTTQGASAVWNSQLLQQYLLPFLFVQAPHQYGIFYADHISSPHPPLQPSRLRHTLWLAFSLLRPLARTHAALLQTLLKPHVELSQEQVQDGEEKRMRVVSDEQRELSLRLVICVASTMDGAAWLLTTFPSLDASLRRACAPSLLSSLPPHSDHEIIKNEASADCRRSAETYLFSASFSPQLDGPLLATAYLRALLHQANTSPSLPPSPPLHDEGEVEDALVTLSVQAAVTYGGLGNGWGQMPLKCFPQQSEFRQQQQQQQQQQMGWEGGLSSTPLPCLINILKEGGGVGGEKTALLPLCWKHIRGCGYAKQSGIALETFSPGAAAPSESAAIDQQQALSRTKIEMILVHVVRWGMLPDTDADKGGFRRSLVRLVEASAGRVSVWQLGIWLIMACGQGEEVLPLLPSLYRHGLREKFKGEKKGEENEGEKEEDYALADRTVETLHREMPEVGGAMIRCGLSARALVLSWYQHSFWGVLSVTELAINETLRFLYGRKGQVALVLALFRHVREELLRAAARQDDMLRLFHLFSHGVRRFEFTPEVVENMGL